MITKTCARLRRGASQPPAPAQKKPRLIGGAGLLFQCASSYLDGDDLNSIQALWALFDVKRHALTFVQALKAGTLDFGVMHKDILATVLGSNKTKALGRIKPFNDTSIHLKHLENK